MEQVGYFGGNKMAFKKAFNSSKRKPHSQAAWFNDHNAEYVTHKAGPNFNRNFTKKNLKEHLETTIHSSGRVLTGHKTAHDFDEQKLTELQGFNLEMNYTL